MRDICHYISRIFYKLLYLEFSIEYNKNKDYNVINFPVTFI